MKLDFSSLAFGFKVLKGGNPPTWSTALDQSKDHKITDSAEMNELIRGMLTSSVPVAFAKTKIGNGGNFVSGADPDSPITMAAVFKKIFVNDTPIPGSQFLLLITKDLEGYHAGRYKLSYGPNNTFDNGTESFSNRQCFYEMKKNLGLSPDACWFSSGIRIRNQDELDFEAHVVNKDGLESYSNSEAQHAAWSAVDPFISPYKAAKESGRTGLNLVLYGVPGSGKSFYLKENYCSDEEQIVRIVFHPDYTYSDFVGQILPHVEKHYDHEFGKEINTVSYDFQPGPFTQILEKAYKQPDKPWYLVIEEINRGNAAAIFGEIFQLLDRNDSGESEYGIRNADIASRVYGNPDHIVKIPSNLSILATMNTSDQNVFTLDTAFKRRWKMKCIKNEFNGEMWADARVNQIGVRWEDFVTIINRRILTANTSMTSTEDKRLGVCFAKKDEIESAELFAEKVLSYLWDDAFKFNREAIFLPGISSLEGLLNEYQKNWESVFTEEIVNEFKAHRDDIG